MTTTAKNYTKGRQGNSIQVLVLHSAENQELPGQAKHLVQWFAGSTAPQASAHEMIDNKEALISVEDSDTAWAVDDFPLNLCSKSYELTGHANNTAAQWADAYETAVIHIAEGEFKRDMKKYGIPAHHLTDAEIVKIHNGNKTIKGICTHADISRALKVVGGHQDPGPNFPIANFIKAVSI
jgi:N-acetyl-anhydromuramyl-L-alanine amidase AmpD